MGYVEKTLPKVSSELGIATLEQLVPSDDLLRKVDLGFIREVTEDLSCRDNGHRDATAQNIKKIAMTGSNGPR